MRPPSSRSARWSRPSRDGRPTRATRFSLPEADEETGLRRFAPMETPEAGTYGRNRCVERAIGEDMATDAVIARRGRHCAADPLRRLEVSCLALRLKHSRSVHTSLRGIESANSNGFAPDRFGQVEHGPAVGKRLASSGEVKLNDYLLRFQTGEFEMTIFQDARSIIRGTDEVAVARSLYAKYIGN